MIYSSLKSRSKRTTIILFLVIFVLVLSPIHTKAAKLNQNYQMVSVGGYEVPTWWSVAAGAVKTLKIEYTSIPNITPDYTLDDYLIFEICTNGPMTDISVTKFNNNSSFSTTDIVKYNTKKSCTTSNGYSGTLWYLQLRIDKWNHVTSSDGYMAETNLNIKDTWNYNVVYAFPNVFTSNEDYLSDYENQQKLENGLDDIKQEQQETNNKLDNIINSDISSDSKLPPDTTDFDNYQNAEGNLLDKINGTTLDSLDFAVDIPTSSFIWTRLSNLVQSHPTVMAMFIAILSIGIIKLVLGR